MRLWKKAFGALKDHNSIWIASLSRRTGIRNPDIEATIIRATTHHEFSLDRSNVDRACEWVRISPFHVKPFLRSISHRMEKTRSWVVALKGLYLMHNVINSNLPYINKMGRLPFDLSTFKDGHSRDKKAWPLEAFIHAYYAYLDDKSALIFQYTEEKRGSMSITQELTLLEKLQALIDLLIRIKPRGRAAMFPLVLDVMDGFIVEIHNYYSRMCRGIAIVLMNIYSADKEEAAAALNVVRKAALQGEELSYYFEYCQEIGVLNASKLSFVDRIPDEGIEELEQIVYGFSEGPSQEEHEEKAVVVREADKKVEYNYEEKDRLRDEFRTIITDKWERFDEDFVPSNPFASPLRNHIYGKYQDLPDLITFS